MKRTQLKRSSWLSPGGGLRRTAMKASRSALKPVSAKRQVENRERRRNVLAEFGTDPECFVCGQPADDAHELLSRARGGSITDVSGIRPVCRPCHTQITENPLWAESHGYALPTQRRKETRS